MTVMAFGIDLERYVQVITCIRGCQAIWSLEKVDLQVIDDIGIELEIIMDKTLNYLVYQLILKRN